MKHEVGLRIIVEAPLAGVTMKVQRGRNYLLPPASKTVDRLVFEFSISVDLSSGSPNFLGEYAQGPKDARFVYVNCGTSAGQMHSPWTRRAKLSLMSVTRGQIERLLNDEALILKTSFAGTGGRDGGPTCASVKGIEWKVVKK
jgi:hypothetical protein